MLIAETTVLTSCRYESQEAQQVLPGLAGSWRIFIRGQQMDPAKNMRGEQLPAARAVCWQSPLLVSPGVLLQVTPRHFILPLNRRPAMSNRLPYQHKRIEKPNSRRNNIDPRKSSRCLGSQHEIIGNACILIHMFPPSICTLDCFRTYRLGLRKMCTLDARLRISLVQLWNTAMTTTRHVAGGAMHHLIDGQGFTINSYT